MSDPDASVIPRVETSRLREVRRFSPTAWEARRRITPHSWVVRYGRTERGARRALARCLAAQPSREVAP